jgi:hypothetical protein
MNIEIRRDENRRDRASFGSELDRSHVPTAFLREMHSMAAIASASYLKRRNKRTAAGPSAHATQREEAACNARFSELDDPSPTNPPTRTSTDPAPLRRMKYDTYTSICTPTDA